MSFSRFPGVPVSSTAVVALVFALLGLPLAGWAQMDRPFPHPNQIRYDRQCLTIGGKDTFIYSGSFHYFRCPKPLWGDRFAKIAAAGFNTVETYVPWNVHEPTQPAGLDDFSHVDLRDLDDWLTMAEQHGLYVIIRPGPYICAEWERGGFPGWLATLRPAKFTGNQWFRSDDPAFVAWSKHWLDEVCPVLAKHQVTHRATGTGGIILFQLENEYDYSNLPDSTKVNYLSALARTAVADGIEVPLFTCVTRCVRENPTLRNVFDTINFYPRWNVEAAGRDIDALAHAQPDAPLMTTELQGGWFTPSTGTPALKPDAHVWDDGTGPSQITNLTLMAWQHGDTLTNDYMLFGGTNFESWGAQGISTSYDYSAPIRENGGVDEKYLAVCALGEIVRSHGTQLTRAVAVPCEVNAGQNDVSVAERRSTDGARFIFVRTDQHAQPRRGTATLKESTGERATIRFDYDLRPFGAKVLYLPPGVVNAERGEWLPKPVKEIARPGVVPRAIHLDLVRSKADPGPADWQPYPGGSSLNAQGVPDARFVFFRWNLEVAAQGGEQAIAVEHGAGDRLVARVNGAAAEVKPAGDDLSIISGESLHTGKNAVEVLYENSGYPNGGGGMEKLGGVVDARLVPAASPVAYLGGWRMRVVASEAEAERLAKAETAGDEADWKAVAINDMAAAQLAPGQTGVFRAEFTGRGDGSKASQTVLDIARLNNRGWVFVNGKQIGQSDFWNQSYRFDASSALRDGRNVVSIIVANDQGAGGLGPVRWTWARSAAADLGSPPMEWSDAAAGVREGWAMPTLDDAGWVVSPLGSPAMAATSRPAASMLCWHRLSFTLPAVDPHVWVPWLARLEASGNGFVYLNGHCLGRYWQDSGQRDFFLPECWLNFGAGDKNVVALCLRPTAAGATLQNATILPYSAYAEARQAAQH